MEIDNQSNQWDKCTVCCFESASSSIVKDSNYLKLLQFYWDGLEIDVKPFDLHNQSLCDHCYQLLLAFYQTNDVLIFHEQQLRAIHWELLGITLNGIKQNQLEVPKLQKEVLDRWSSVYEICNRDCQSNLGLDKNPMDNYEDVDYDFTADDYFGDQEFPKAPATGQQDVSKYCCIPEPLKSRLTQRLESNIPCTTVLLERLEASGKFSWVLCKFCEHWYPKSQLQLHRCSAVSAIGTEKLCIVPIEDDKSFKKCSFCCESVPLTEFAHHFQQRHEKPLEVAVKISLREALEIRSRKRPMQVPLPSPSTVVVEDLNVGNEKKTETAILLPNPHAAKKDFSNVPSVPMQANINQQLNPPKKKREYFFCKSCNCRFWSYKKLIKHQVEHALQKSGTRIRRGNSDVALAKVELDKQKDVIYKCRQCHEKLTSRKSLQQHIVAHHPPNRRVLEIKFFFCNYCPKAFTLAQTIKTHIRAFHADRIPKELQVEDIFDNGDQILNIWDHFTNKKLCDGEGEKPALQEQIVSDHPPKRVQKDQFFCNHCPKSFSLAQTIKTHIRAFHLDRIPKELQVGDLFDNGDQILNIWDHFSNKKLFDGDGEKAATEPEIIEATEERPTLEFEQKGESEQESADIASQNTTNIGIGLISKAFTGSSPLDLSKDSKGNQSSLTNESTNIGNQFSAIFNKMKQAEPALPQTPPRHSAGTSGGWKLYKCRICHHTLMREVDLIRHLQSAHSGLPESKHYQCNLCGLAWKCKASVIRHLLKTHDKSKDDVAKESLITQATDSEIGAHQAGVLRSGSVPQQPEAHAQLVQSVGFSNSARPSVIVPPSTPTKTNVVQPQAQSPKYGPMQFDVRPFLMQDIISHTIKKLLDKSDPSVSAVGARKRTVSGSLCSTPPLISASPPKLTSVSASSTPLKGSASNCHSTPTKEGALVCQDGESGSQLWIKTIFS